MDDLAIEILAGLEDGVIVCEEGGAIRWLNPAARRMLGLPDDAPAPARLEELGLAAMGHESLPASLRERDVYRIGDHYAVVSQVNLSAGRALALRDCSEQVAEWKTAIELVFTLRMELLTPCTVIRGNCDLLLRGLAGPMDDEQKVFVESIRQHASWMTRLVHNVSVIAGLERGFYSDDLEPISLLWPIEEAAAPLRSLIAVKGLSLRIEVPENVPEVLADFDQLRLVMHHLLDNARRYTSEGRIVVRARAFIEHVQVEVEDTGRGIPPDIRDQVFQRFVRGYGLSEGINSSERGIGLGLAICKELVELMGGRIWIAEAPDGGTRVCFTLRYAG